MKFVHKTSLLLTMLMCVGESATAGDHKICWVFLKRESDIFIKELEYAVITHSLDDESVLTRSYNSINAFRKMIEHALAREVINCAYYNSLAYRLRERPLFPDAGNSVYGMDKFFANLGADLLSIMPFENLMEYSGIVDDAIRGDLSFLFSTAKRIGLTTVVVKNLIAILWTENGYEKFSTRIARMRSLFEEKNVAELRVQLGIDELRFSNKPGLARLYRATKMFDWLMDPNPKTHLPYSFSDGILRDLNEFISQSDGTSIPPEIVDAVIEMVESLHFLSPGGRSMMHRSAQLIVARLRESLAAEPNMLASIIEELKQKLDLVVPFLKILASHKNKQAIGDMKIMLRRVAALGDQFEVARTSIVPILSDFVKIFSYRAIMVKRRYGEYWSKVHLNIVEPVLSAAIGLVEEGKSERSFVALIEILVDLTTTLFEARHIQRGFQTSRNKIYPVPMGMVEDAVLNAVFKFSLKFGINLLGDYPELMPGMRVMGAEKLLDIFLELGEAEWRALLFQGERSGGLFVRRRFFYGNFQTLPELQVGLNFLNTYVVKEQLNRAKGIFNDFPLLSPATFFREYVGMPSQDLAYEYIQRGDAEDEPEEFLLRRSDFIDLFAQQFHLFADWGDLNSGATNLPTHLVDENIRPFLPLEEQHNFFATLSKQLSGIYNHHGVSLDVEYPNLMLAARNLPMVLLRIFIQTREKKQEMLKALVALGRTFLKIIQGTGIDENKKISAAMIVEFKEAREVVYSLIDKNAKRVIPFWEYTDIRDSVAGKSCKDFISSLVNPALNEVSMKIRS